MDSTPDQIIDHLVTIIRAALPGRQVERNADEPERIPAGGWVVIRDGDPGEPEALISPRRWIYTHAIRVEVAAPGLTLAARNALLADLLGPIGAAVAADPTLGGRCDWCEPTAPSRNDAIQEGVQTVRWAEFDLNAEYTLTNPLS